jgi:hypothetical protein
MAVVGETDGGAWYVVLGEADYDDDHPDGVDPVMRVEDPPDSEKWSDEPAEYNEAIYGWSTPP